MKQTINHNGLKPCGKVCKFASRINGKWTHDVNLTRCDSCEHRIKLFNPAWYEEYIEMKVPWGSYDRERIIRPVMSSGKLGFSSAIGKVRI